MTTLAALCVCLESLNHACLPGYNMSQISRRTTMQIAFIAPCPYSTAEDVPCEFLELQESFFKRRFLKNYSLALAQIFIEVEYDMALERIVVRVRLLVDLTDELDKVFWDLIAHLPWAKIRHEPTGCQLLQVIKEESVCGDVY